MGSGPSSDGKTRRMIMEKKRSGKIGKGSFLRKGFKFSLLFRCLFFVFGAFFAVQVSAQDLETLSEQVRSGSVEEKREALFQIRNLESAEASRAAIAALRDRSDIVRATAAFSVIFLPPAEAVQSLVPNLKDKSEIVRRETAYALGLVGDPSATASLLQTLNKDRALEVRTAAAVALGRIGDPSAVDALNDILRRKPRGEEEFLRRSAARSIGQIAQIVQTGERKVLTPENFLPDRYKELKRPKYLDLKTQIPVFARAAETLKTVLADENESGDVRREAAFSLGAIGDETAVSLLRSKSDDKDYYLAEIAQEALRKIEFLQQLKNN
jgi:HEAT repeat protein